MNVHADVTQIALKTVMITGVNSRLLLSRLCSLTGEGSVYTREESYTPKSNRISFKRFRYHALIGN